MAMKGQYGQIIINDGKDVLVREIVRMLPYTTITLLGPSGSGKTTLVEEIAKDPRLGIDKFVTLRMQGMAAEDFRLPIIVDETDVKTGRKKSEETLLNLETGHRKVTKSVEFANIGIFKEIIDNPDKKYLLFLDEILRINAECAPLLFGLLEKRIDGIVAKNLYIMTAANYGSEYIVNLDLSDSALRRRQIFIEWVPNKEDIQKFMEEKNYHPVIRDLVDSLDLEKIIDHEAVKELEQDSQLGSWNLLNNRWKDMELIEKIPMTYNNCKTDAVLFGSYFFTDRTLKAITDKLTLLEQVNTLDLQKEIVDNEGLTTPDYVVKDRQGHPFDIKGKEREILIRTKYMVKDNILKDFKYAEKYADKIFKLFVNNEAMLAAFFNEMNKAFEEQFSESVAREKKTNFANYIYKAGVKGSKTDKKLKKVFDNFAEGIRLANSGR